MRWEARLSYKQLFAEEENFLKSLQINGDKKEKKDAHAHKVREGKENEKGWEGLRLMLVF